MIVTDVGIWFCYILTSVFVPNMNNMLIMRKMVKMEEEKNDVIVINEKIEIASESVFIKRIMKPS